MYIMLNVFVPSTTAVYDVRMASNMKLSDIQIGIINNSSIMGCNMFEIEIMDDHCNSIPRVQEFL